MQISKKVQAGFTLIELMIVVAIIGILASIAIPQYQDFINKSAFKEVTSLVAGDRKVGVELCTQELGATAADPTVPSASCIGGLAAAAWSGRLGSIPADGTADFDGDTTDEASFATAASGVITATIASGSNRYGSGCALGCTYVMTPEIQNSGAVAWRVSGSAVTAGLASDNTEN